MQLHQLTHGNENDMKEGEKYITFANTAGVVMSVTAYSVRDPGKKSSCPFAPRRDTRKYGAATDALGCLRSAAGVAPHRYIHLCTLACYVYTLSVLCYTLVCASTLVCSEQRVPSGSLNQTTIKSPLFLDALLVQHEVDHEGGTARRPPRLVRLQGAHERRVGVVQDHEVRLQVFEDVEAFSRLRGAVSCMEQWVLFGVQMRRAFSCLGTREGAACSRRGGLSVCLEQKVPRRRRVERRCLACGACL